MTGNTKSQGRWNSMTRSQHIDSLIDALERSADHLSTVFFIRKKFILSLCNLGFSLPGDHPYSVTTALTAHTHALSKIQNSLPTPNNAWVYQTLKYANPTIWTESHFFLFQSHYQNFDPTLCQPIPLFIVYIYNPTITLLVYTPGFTSGVGVSVYLKGDIRLITDVFLFFLFDNRRRAASVGDNADFVRYGAGYRTALRDRSITSV